MNGAFSDQERIESLKAATLTGLAAGSTAMLILLAHRSHELGWARALASVVTPGLSGWGFWVGSAIALFSGSLFGITYRYAVRQDENPQLKSGVVLAFGLVRGLAQVDVGSALAQNGSPFLTAVAESLLLFGTAGLFLDLALRNAWIKPFKSSL
ncbi:MAG TPA: hypothetical protein V6D29_04805 [Leptolyngbyaceae cyanobacterium]